MPHPAPVNGGAQEGSDERCRRALAEAVAGLEIIRDEGPPADPVYPEHGDVEAHDAWGFDSASYERAETARDTLTAVADIVGDRSISPS